jgi:hypothetical protein
MSLTRPEDIAWMESLIRAGLLSRQALLDCLAHEKQNFEALETALDGQLCQIRDHQLQIRQLSSGHVHLSHPLESGAATVSHQAPICLLLDETRGTPLHTEPLTTDTGLLLNSGGTRLSTPEDLKADWLKLSPKLTPAGYERWDLQQEHDTLYLTDRHAGTISLLDTTGMTRHQTFTLRSPGGKTCLNLSHDIRLNRLLLTDSTSTRMACLWLHNGRIDRIHPGVGLLGNLCVAPDQEHVLVLLLRPTQELLCLRLSDWRVHKRIALSGHLCRQQGNLPGDPLLLSPDQRHLLILSWQSGDPPQPLLSTLDLHSLKIVAQATCALPPGPVQLAWGRPNPLKNYQQRSLREILLEAGLITPELLTYQEPGGLQAQKPAVVLRQPLPGTEKPPAATPPAVENKNDEALKASG